MNQAQLTEIASGALMMAAKLALPILLTSLVVGLLMSLVQSITQVQEVTLAFVPKLLALSLVLTVTGHWMLGQIVAYTQHLIGHAGTLVGG